MRPARILTREDAREESCIIAAHAQRLYDAVYRGGTTVVRDDEVIAITELRRQAIDVRELLRHAA